MAKNTSFIRWAGGKAWFVPAVHDMIQNLQFNNYIEPFMGGASIFFSLDLPNKAYLSDINGELANTFIQIRDNLDLVTEKLKEYKSDKESYYEIRKQDPVSLIEQAARFLYLNFYSFNGIYRVNSRGKFNVPYGRKLGILHIPKRYRSAYIIDGQHRLYGYSDSKYASTNTVPVVAFVDLDRTEQIKLFMDINENQKAVPKSLRVTLNADMLWESKDPNERRQALRSKIAQMLGEEPTSPLRSRVIIGEAEAVPGRCITIEAIQAALKKCNFFNTYSKKGELISKGSFDLEDNQESCDLFYPFIEKCFLYIRENCLDEWNKGDKEDGMLTINRGIHGIIRVLDDLVNMLVEKGMIHPKNQDVEDMFVLLKYYLKPLTEYINGLTTEQRKEIKKVFGGGGDVRFWRAYQKAIADVRVDFKPEGLDEYWLNEAKTFNDETRIMIGEIENKLKTIISDSLQEYFGTSWLVKGLPKNTYTKAKKLADEKAYDLQLNSGDDAEDVNVWDFVSLADYVSIVTNGKNWSSFFEEMLVRPEETRIAGGKEAKTQWILRLSAIKNKLSKESYSVPVDEYSYVKSVYDWIMEMLTL